MNYNHLLSSISGFTLLNSTAAIFAGIVFLSLGTGFGNAQTVVPVPGGNITINQDGSFGGNLEERARFSGFPDEVDTTSVSGQINQSTGQITGFYVGTSTYNVVSSGAVSSITEPVSGNISGQISPDGSYTVNWTGKPNGSRSGVLPVVVVTPPPTPLPNLPEVQNNFNSISGNSNASENETNEPATLGPFRVKNSGKQAISNDPKKCAA